MSIIELNDEAFSLIYNERMVEDFPDNELKPLDRILANKNAHQLGYELDSLKGYASCVVVQKYCLIDYFAIYKEFRNDGYGSAFLQALLEKYKDKIIVVESEVPYDDISTKRLDFYQRNGLILSNYPIDLFGVKFHLLSNVKLQREEIDYAYSLFYPPFLKEKHFKFLNEAR